MSGGGTSIAPVAPSRRPPNAAKPTVGVPPSTPGRPSSTVARTRDVGTASTGKEIPSSPPLTAPSSLVHLPDHRLGPDLAGPQLMGGGFDHGRDQIRHLQKT
ncbi:hypothetical protein FVEN_g12817 [Fusarium venenatum]|nr:hypothetical protein FVEN_g12817 [Fusarium venenatum]